MPLGTQLLDGSPDGPEYKPCFAPQVLPWALLPELQPALHPNSSFSERCLGRACHECPNQIMVASQTRTWYVFFSSTVPGVMLGTESVFNKHC